MPREQILFLIGAYLLGAIPFGYLVVRLCTKKDIRRLGSCSTGATNVLRSQGLAAALATLLFDVTKGALPIAYGKVHHLSSLLMISAGALVVIGHVFPVFIRFHGGKGVGPLAGVFLVFYFPALLVFSIVWLSVIMVNRYVSLGSILGVLALFFCTLFTQTAEVSLVVLLMTLLIIGRHRANIQRLLLGGEHKLQLQKRRHGA